MSEFVGSRSCAARTTWRRASIAAGGFGAIVVIRTFSTAVRLRDFRNLLPTILFIGGIAGLIWIAYALFDLGEFLGVSPRRVVTTGEGLSLTWASGVHAFLSWASIVKADYCTPDLLELNNDIGSQYFLYAQPFGPEQWSALTSEIEEHLSAHNVPATHRTS